MSKSTWFLGSFARDSERMVIRPLLTAAFALLRLALEAGSYVAPLLLPEEDAKSGSLRLATWLLAASVFASVMSASLWPLLIMVAIIYGGGRLMR